MNLKEKYYLEAVHHFIDYTTGDATSTIAYEQGIIGLTRIIACLDSIGLPYDKTYMIALPDFTFTRNKKRWDAGFPYGCVIRINNNKDIPFIPFDFRPNCCGIIFAEISEFHQDLDFLANKYFEIIHKLQNVEPCDLNRRNHFIAVYCDQLTNKYYCLIHCSFKFVKQKLYSEHNSKLLECMKSFDFMSGTIHYFIGDVATEYYRNYTDLQEKTLTLRETILKELFPNSNVLFHQTHEGFWDQNTILLGSYAANSAFEYPLMLCPNSNLYMIHVNRRIDIPSEENFFCAPHGGGYELSSIVSADKINSEYLLKYPNGCQFLTNNIIDMPFNYRNGITFDWCEKYSMGEVTHILTPIINLKI